MNWQDLNSAPVTDSALATLPNRSQITTPLTPEVFQGNWAQVVLAVSSEQRVLDVSAHVGRRERLTVKFGEDDVGLAPIRLGKAAVSSRSL